MSIEWRMAFAALAVLLAAVYELEKRAGVDLWLRLPTILCGFLLLILGLVR